MDAFETLRARRPYDVPDREKYGLFAAAMRESLLRHIEHCPPYARLCGKKGFNPKSWNGIPATVPYVPAELFKTMRLQSRPDEQIIRSLTSSATTGQTPSLVMLDDATRRRQMRTLAWLLSSLLYGTRRRFIVFDAPPPAVDPGGGLAARAAAIRGFLSAARGFAFVMKRVDGDSLSIDETALAEAIAVAEKEGAPPVVLGFTYVLHAYAARPAKEKGASYPIPGATVLHIGGWKRLRDEAVEKQAFNADVAAMFGIPDEAVVDIYGFTEQLGVIYPDGRDGVKRCPLVSEIVVRDPFTMRPLPDGDEGLLEFITPLPLSYPGCAVLTDDIGRVVDRMPGADGRNGTAFVVTGRARGAETRGCGDVMPARMRGGL